MKKFLNIFISILVLSNIYIWQNISLLNVGNGILEITVLDIGQGDAILIKTPNNLYGLIDGGKNNKVIEELSTTIPYFIKTLEFVVFTHPDLDHIGGLNEVLQKYSVKNVFIQKTKKDSEAYKLALNQIDNKNIQNFAIHDANDFQVDEVKFDVIWPLKTTNTSTLDSNLTSIGIILSYSNFTFYTAGDLSSELELKSIENISYSHIDVLKVGHHGSKTSSNIKFLEKIKPKVSLISAGKNNSYGHPNKEVLSNLEKVDSKIYRTDLNGRIMLQTNGEFIKQMCELCNGKISEISAL